VGWVVDAEDALRDLEDRLRPTEYADILLACAEYVFEWVLVGPPEDAEYDPLYEVFLCDVPGTPVVVEHVKAVHVQAVRVLRFRWMP
jgi:hypothetical protein